MTLGRVACWSAYALGFALMAWAGHVRGPADLIGHVLFGIALAMIGRSLIRLGTEEPPRDDVRFFGLAFLCIAAEATVAPFVQLFAPSASGVVGLAFSVLLVLLVMRGIAAGMRMHADRLSVFRGVLEAVMIGATTAIVAWRWVFYDLVASDQASIVVGGLVLVESVLIGALLAGIVREADAGLRQAQAAGIISILGNSVLIYQVSIGQRPLVGLTACLGSIPVIAHGLWRSGQAKPRTDENESRREAQRLIFVATLVALTMITALASLVAKHFIDPFTWMLVGIFVLALWSRETVRARQHWTVTDQLTRQAAEDPLTGLPNRRALKARLAGVDVAAVDCLSFVTVDLDGFKNVNDLLGHSTGDRLLIAVGQGLVGFAGPAHGDVYRMGGDEFLLVLPCDPAQALAIAEHLGEVVDRSSRQVPGIGRVALGVSIGVKHLVVHPETFEADATSAITLSGHAMRAAKQAGKGRVVVFDGSLADSHVRRLRVEERLRALLDGGGCVDVHYQPLMSLSTGRMAGVESLARWTDDVLGVVNPQEFIQVAEECGLIETLGDRILNKALEELSVIGFFDRGLKLSVNFSTIQMRQPRYAQDLLKTLDKYAIDASLLVVEVTESVFVSPDDPAAQALAALERAGVGIAIDDFGTGYSSIGYLHRLPVKLLKIDRSLCNTLTDTRTVSIVRGIVEMTRGLGLEVVLEGVETRAQQDRAYELGVNYNQGWLYSKAVPAGDLPSLMDRLRTSSSLEAPVSRVPRARHAATELSG